MKKTILVLVACFVSTIAVKAEPNKYQIEQTKLLPFNVYISDTDPLRKDLPVITYDGDKGYTIYLVEQNSNNKASSNYRLVLTDDGKPVASNLTDKNYHDNLYDIFLGGNAMFFVGDPALESITLTFISPKVDDEIHGGSGKIYSKELFFNFRKRNKQYYVGSQYNSLLSVGSIAYMDSNFQVEWRENQNNTLVVTRREAVIPYYGNESLADLPGIKDAGSDFWIFSGFKGLGYAHLKVDSGVYGLNGIVYDESRNLSSYQLIKTNNTLMMDAFLLRDLLLCQYEASISDSSKTRTDLYTFYRLIQNRNKVETIAVNIDTNNGQYTVDGVSKNFSIKPYRNKQDMLMVPLVEMCDVLKSRVFYRQLDDSVLISRSIVYDYTK